MNNDRIFRRKVGICRGEESSGICTENTAPNSTGLVHSVIADHNNSYYGGTVFDARKLQAVNGKHQQGQADNPILQPIPREGYGKRARIGSIAKNIGKTMSSSGIVSAFFFLLTSAICGHKGAIYPMPPSTFYATVDSFKRLDSIQVIQSDTIQAAIKQVDSVK